MLLSAPKYFNLKETEKGTVLVHKGILVKEDVGETYGNRQFYFMDKADGQLKCLSGGSLNYIVDLHKLGETKLEVKITYNGAKKLEDGKYKGKTAHQFIVEAEDDQVQSVVEEVKPQVVESNDPDDLE